MTKFLEAETQSAPIALPRQALLRDPIVGVRLHGTDREFEFRPRRKRLTVGTSADADICLEDPRASRQHCVLERQSTGGFVVRDRSSKNGTFLNGNRVSVAEVRPGALLTVGKTTLVFISQRGRGRRTALEQLRGNDKAFRDAVNTAVRAATTGFSVLILGETGTGKDLVARAIHESSQRSAQPFVALNCGAIPAQLIGSELFGHVQGAFTGAVRDHDGVFARADGGTLFLDELAELPLEQQPHLLRVLETQSVRAVGGAEEAPVDVRLVAATNRLNCDLGADSGLRLDLYHRIATVVIDLPPLRQRTDDIPVLVRAFIRDLTGNGEGQGEGVALSRGTMGALRRYDWPGNVRELLRATERAIALGGDELVITDFLPPKSSLPGVDLRRLEPSTAVFDGKAGASDGIPKRTRKRPESRARTVSERKQQRWSNGFGQLLPTAPQLSPMDEHTREVIMDALNRHGSIRRAAEALGVARSTFADRCRRYGIKTSWI